MATSAVRSVGAGNILTIGGDELAFFRVTLLPAGQGDSILLEYGDPAAPFRILIDGGPARCYDLVSARLAAVIRDRRRIDLLVLTHVDADHIEGVLKLVNDANLALEVGEVWFNGYQQLPSDEDDYLGPPHGEILSTLISSRDIPWNTPFNRGPVVRERTAPLPCIDLPGGLTLTVLGPDEATLRSLRSVWEEECRKAGIAPGSTRDALDLLARQQRLRPLDTYLADFDPEALATGPESSADSSVTNASSIVLLAEYDGRGILLPGDATPTVLAEGLERLLAERGRSVLDVEAVKLPHHGSRRNVTRGVLDLVRSPTYLVSTDSSYFRHPDPEAIARVVVGHGARRLVFNYRTEITDRWSDQALTGRFGYDAIYPAVETKGVALEI